MFQPPTFAHGDADLTLCRQSPLDRYAGTGAARAFFTLSGKGILHDPRSSSVTFFFSERRFDSNSASGSWALVLRTPWK